MNLNNKDTIYCVHTDHPVTTSGLWGNKTVEQIEELTKKLTNLKERCNPFFGRVSTLENKIDTLERTIEYFAELLQGLIEEKRVADTKS